MLSHTKSALGKPLPLPQRSSAAWVRVLVLLMCAPLPALAVNRCKDAQGNVTFSDTPCPKMKFQYEEHVFVFKKQSGL